MGLLSRLSGLVHSYEPECVEPVSHDTVIVQGEDGKPIELTADAEESEE